MIILIYRCQSQLDSHYETPVNTRGIADHPILHLEELEIKTTRMSQ